MKKTKFTESQHVTCIKEHESGRKAEVICRELGINRSTFYYWKKRYSGMDSLQLKRLKERRRKPQAQGDACRPGP